MSTELPAPEHLGLDELIAILEAHDPATVVKVGFADPHSYRGYYHEVAFEPAANVTVGAMLADARAALGATYQGYKGGDYTMSGYTSVWLASYGCTGESLGRVLLTLLLANAATPDPQENPAGPAPTTPHYRTGKKNSRNLYQVNPDGTETHFACTFHEHAGPLVVEALNQWEQRKQAATTEAGA